MSIRSRILVLASLALAACSNPTAPADLAPALAKGGSTPAITPNLSGHWTQPNLMIFNGVLGTTHSWYEMNVKQSGSTLSGSAERHSIIYNADGSVGLAEFTGSPGKVTGTVKADGTATIVFSRIEETKITLSYSVTLSADGTTLTVVNPTPGGALSFVR